MLGAEKWPICPKISGRRQDSSFCWNSPTYVSLSEICSRQTDENVCFWDKWIFHNFSPLIFLIRNLLMHCGWVVGIQGWYENCPYSSPIPEKISSLKCTPRMSKLMMQIKFFTSENCPMPSPSMASTLLCGDTSVFTITNTKIQYLI